MIAGAKGTNLLRHISAGTILLWTAVVLMTTGSFRPARADSDGTEDEAAGVEIEAKPAAETTVKEQLKEVWERDLFTGDWAGLRTKMGE